MRVDGSAVSRLALRWAVGQARLTGAVVKAVTAWTYPTIDERPERVSAVRLVGAQDRPGTERKPRRDQVGVGLRPVQPVGAPRGVLIAEDERIEHRPVEAVVGEQTDGLGLPAGGGGWRVRPAG
ncbi:hypothetical protein [Kitasatospora sp. NPDC056531]|uniref:hypothetical protein n=1 Tax=Kitasatospora sp. NPDC056531 TaxID=3345856 RepID=UPI0036CF87BC